MTMVDNTCIHVKRDKSQTIGYMDYAYYVHS